MRINHTSLSVAVVSRRCKLVVPGLIWFRISGVVLLDNLFMASWCLVRIVSRIRCFSYRIICGSRCRCWLMSDLSYRVMLYRSLWIAMDSVCRYLSHFSLRILDWTNFSLRDNHGSHRCIVNSFIRHDSCERVLLCSNQLPVTEFVWAGSSEQIEELLERDTVVTISIHSSDDGVQTSFAEIFVMLHHKLVKLIS